MSQVIVTLHGVPDFIDKTEIAHNIIVETERLAKITASDVTILFAEQTLVMRRYANPETIVAFADVTRGHNGLHYIEPAIVNGLLAKAGLNKFLIQCVVRESKIRDMWPK